MVVVGAGFIGSEVAATAHGLGLRRDGGRGAAVPLVRRSGRDGRGVRRPPPGPRRRPAPGRRGRGVRRPGPGRGRVRSTDGSAVAADVVVVGVGVAPATGWLEGSGSSSATAWCATHPLAAGPPGVYAAGDSPLAQPALRRGDAGRALDQRRRAGRARRRTIVGVAPASRRSRTRRCRSSGATSTASGGPVPRAGQRGRRGPGRARLARGARLRGPVRPGGTPAGSFGMAKPQARHARYPTAPRQRVTWDGARPRRWGSIAHEVTRSTNRVRSLNVML